MATRAEVLASLKRRITERTGEIAINATAEAKAATPVDTGFARANWQITIGAPATGTVPIGASAVMPDTYDAERDGSVYVTNNTRYIRRLNGGSSSQAPAGFVEAAIARAVAE